ncbi:MAG: 3-phosphoglycerate dehydrogenase [Dysgonamonadaceae bacterium]|jgi:D-3-phosphoglycerate dehydrogenase|nr:3-phosphoglycerate dehydrogenase [Dysgonamonadaceae bacterium]
MKILIATQKPFASDAVNEMKRVIETAGYRACLLERYDGKQQLLEAAADADAIIIRSDIVDDDVIGVAKNLKIVVRAGAGYDNVDLVAATKNDVIVMNTPGQNSNAVAELAVGMMLYAVRNFYDGSTGTELRGKRLGIHAYGNVGRSLARIALGFGMEVFAYDLFCPVDVIEKDGVKPLASAEELYTVCRYVSLHVPSTAETRNSVNYALLERLPANAMLVNTARRDIINEVDLEAFMTERKDFRYLTDVAPSNDSIMKEKFPGRYFATPKKTGAQTFEANSNAGVAAAGQVVDFFRTGKRKFQVN